MRGFASGLALYALVVALFVAPVHLADDPVEGIESVVRLPWGARVLLHDLTGDGAADLVRVDESGLAVFPLGADGRYPESPAGVLAWPEGRIGWDLGDLDGSGLSAVALLDASGAVRAYRLGAEGFDAGRLVLEDRVALPDGVQRVHFVRDVDGDARADLVLPSAGSHRIFFARDAGWSAPIEVAYELDASTEVGDPASLSSSFGQEVRVPWFRLEDIDGDGRLDLVSETSERVAFHLAAPAIPETPTWTLSLEDLRAELPKRQGFDFDDLLANIDTDVTWRFADLDGRAPRDLIVLLGSKLRVYLGGAATGPTETPDQVLKSSGSVLWSLVRQVEGDALPDLQLVRGERLSIGRALRALILPSSIDFDLYTYRNEGGTFSKKPTRKNRVTFTIPRLLTLIDEKKGLDERLETSTKVQAARMPNASGVAAAGDDILDIDGNELVLFRERAPEPSLVESLAGNDPDVDVFLEAFFLRDLDARGDGAERTMDLGELMQRQDSRGVLLRAACAGQAPTLRRPLAVAGGQVRELRTPDLDGDGRADVVVVGRTDQGWVVQFLVLREDAGRPSAPRGPESSR